MQAVRTGDPQCCISDPKPLCWVIRTGREYRLMPENRDLCKAGTQLEQSPAVPNSPIHSVFISKQVVLCTVNITCLAMLGASENLDDPWL